MFHHKSRSAGDGEHRCLWSQGSLASPRMFRRFATGVILALSPLLLSACFTTATPATTTTTFPKSGLAAEPPTRVLYKACGATRDLTSATFSTTFLHPVLTHGYRSDMFHVGPGGSSGSITTTSMGQASIVSTPLAIYLKASAKFWENLSPTFASSASALASRWVAISVDAPSFPAFSGLADLASLSRILAGCFNTATTAGTATVNGLPVVYLHVPGGPGTQALGVALKGDPLIISMTQFSGAHTLSDTTLSNFNTGASITAPSSAAPLASLLK